MGFIKWICKRLKCRSTCSYNQEAILDYSVLNHKLNDYELKMKDIIIINTILLKRGRKPTYPHYCTEI